MEKIKVNIKKTWCGRFYSISGKMPYNTFLKLGDNLSKKAIEYGKKVYGKRYPKQIELYTNDVSISGYDYQTNEADFCASTRQDVKNWLMLHKNTVYADKF